MILALILGTAAIGLMINAFGDGQTETTDPVGEDGLRVTGSDEGDLLKGQDGDDRFFGKDGADLLIGQDGADQLFGAEGADTLLGGTGDDLLRGGVQGDLLIGDLGADQILGDGGDDTIISAAILDDSAMAQQVAQATYADQITPEFDYRTDLDASDHVDGGPGQDDITFGSDDSVSGGDDADLLRAGDWIAPGQPATITDYDAQEDVLVYSHAGDAPDITAQVDDQGTATVFADGRAVLIIPNAGPDFDPDQVMLELRHA